MTRAARREARRDSRRRFRVCRVGEGAARAVKARREGATPRGREGAAWRRRRGVVPFEVDDGPGACAQSGAHPPGSVAAERERRPVPLDVTECIHVDPFPPAISAE